MAMVRQVVDRVSAVVREEGLAAVLARVAKVAGRAFRRSTADEFDSGLKIDTWREVPLWKLRVQSENAAYGSKYQTTDPSVFLDAVQKVPIDARDFTFIDLGCGKGRALILAAKLGFRRVIGIEFSAELAQIARQNIHQVGIQAEILETDASRFNFVDGNLLIYMYNPFGKSVMHSVVENLVAWRSHDKSQAYLVYINPVCHREIEASGVVESILRLNDLGVWQLR